MKIPGKLKVGGKVYKVIRNYRWQDRADRCGQSEHDQLQIKLGGWGSDNQRLPSPSVEETLLHEIIHCVDRVYNAHKLEEDSVLRLSEGLYQVLTDNGFLK